MLHSRLLGIAAAMFAAGVPLLVGAQPAPSPSPSPGPAATPVGSPANPTPPPATQQQGTITPKTLPHAFSRYPVIDVIVTDTEQAIATVPSQMHDYQALTIGGSVRIPITRAISASYARIVGGGLNSAQEIQNLGAVKPGNIHDVIQNYSLTERLNRFTLAEGLSFRHRMWNNGGPGVSSAPYPYTVASVEHHYAYLGVTYTTPPIKELLHSTMSFNITGNAQNVDHHVAVCAPGGAGPGGFGCRNGVVYRDEAPGKDRWYDTTQLVSLLIPVDRKHGTSLLVAEGWGAGNFYEAAPFPYQYSSRFFVQLSKKFSDFFTLSLRSSNYHGQKQGAPLPLPAVIHPQWVDIIADFHIDTGKLVAH